MWTVFSKDSELELMRFRFRPVDSDESEDLCAVYKEKQVVRLKVWLTKKEIEDSDELEGEIRKQRDVMGSGRVLFAVTRAPSAQHLPQSPSAAHWDYGPLTVSRVHLAQGTWMPCSGVGVPCNGLRELEYPEFALVRDLTSWS